MESSPRNSQLCPAEGSICSSPEKRELIVSDKDGEQCDGDKHSSECAYQTVIYKFNEADGGEVEQGSDHSLVPSKRPRQKTISIRAYAAQCATCEKWRFIPMKQKYEEVRAQIQTDPFQCEMVREWKSDVTCNDPSDVSLDGTLLWAMDQHGIPQPPPRFERLIAIRGKGCTRFADVYYTTPTGKKLRSGKEVKSYLEENPDYASQGVNSSQFSFKIPTPAQHDYVRKRAKTNENDGSRKEPSEPLVEEVQPIAWSASRTHEEPGDDNQLVLYNEGLPGVLQPEPPQMEMENPPPLSSLQNPNLDTRHGLGPTFGS